MGRKEGTASTNRSGMKRDYRQRGGWTVLLKGAGELEGEARVSGAQVLVGGEGSERKGGDARCPLVKRKGVGGAQTDQCQSDYGNK